LDHKKDKKEDDTSHSFFCACEMYANSTAGLSYQSIFFGLRRVTLYAF